VTAGTRGDTQPYLALGIGLQRAGHQVTVAAGANYESFIRQYGLDFAPMRADFAGMLNSPEAQRVLEADNPIQFMVAQMQATRKVRRLDQLQDDVWLACQDAEAILYSPGMPNGYFMARKLGIPSIALNVVPMSPTRAFPAAVLYAGPRLGTVYNRLTHALFEQAFWFGFRSGIQTFWRKQDATIQVPLASPNRRQRQEHYPVLYGYSELVLPRPRDWPDYVSVTGYWFLDDTPDWSPPAALVDFLKAGPPPVYIGFGSMSSPGKARQMTETVLQALAMSGQRGVLASGWRGLSQDVQLPSTVYMLDSVPHNWLFPQMAAVVHHGGAGTTAAGLRAGVPSIVIPYAVDQPMWGRRVAELGVGPAPIPRKQLTAERLADAITATTDQGMRARAADLGQQIRAENGIARAVELLEQHLRR